MTGEGAPNPWSTLHADTNSYITLASALLGVSATFAGGLLSDDTIGRMLVIGGWAALSVSIAASIYAKGKVFSGLRREYDGIPLSRPSQPPNELAGAQADAQVQASEADEMSKRKYTSASAFLNVSVMCLLAGTALLAGGAWRTATSDSSANSSATAAAMARDVVAEMTGGHETGLTVETLEKDIAGAYVLVIRRSAAERFEVTVAGDPLDVVEVCLTR